MTASVGETVLLRRKDFANLLSALTGAGYKVVGPTVREDAIVYDEIGNVAQMPIGLTEVQEAGTYRLRQRSDQALFGYAVGPDSWKRLLHLPTIRLWSAHRETDSQFVVARSATPLPRWPSLVSAHANCTRLRSKTR